MQWERRWTALWSTWGVTPRADLLAELLARWDEPHRHYHTREHLASCLTWLDQTHHLAARSDEVEAALWFHDAVYEPKASDNEPESAQWAAAALREAGVDGQVADRVHALVLVTDHQSAPQGRDAALITDIDLAVLGAAPDVFAAYEVAVRREYAFVSDDAWREGRGEVLRSFLARAPLYRTAPLRERLEAQARKNLARSLRALKEALAGHATVLEGGDDDAMYELPDPKQETDRWRFTFRRSTGGAVYLLVPATGYNGEFPVHPRQPPWLTGWLLELPGVSEVWHHVWELRDRGVVEAVNSRLDAAGATRVDP